MRSVDEANHVDFERVDSASLRKVSPLVFWAWDRADMVLFIKNEDRVTSIPTSMQSSNSMQLSMGNATDSWFFGFGIRDSKQQPSVLSAYFRRQAPRVSHYRTFWGHYFFTPFFVILISRVFRNTHWGHKMCPLSLNTSHLPF